MNNSLWWSSKEYLISAPNDELHIAMRARFMRKFEWQIQVRGALVAHGKGVDRFAEDGMEVVAALDQQGLTDSAGYLRRLVIALAEERAS